MLIHKLNSKSGEKEFSFLKENYDGPYFCEVNDEWADVESVRETDDSFIVTLKNALESDSRVNFYKLLSTIPPQPIKNFKETVELIQCRSKFFQLKDTNTDPASITFTNRLRFISNKLVENGGIMLYPIIEEPFTNDELLTHISNSEPMEDSEGAALIVTDAFIFNIGIKNMIGSLGSKEFLLFKVFRVNTKIPFNKSDVTPIIVDKFSNRRGEVNSGLIDLSEYYIQIQDEPVEKYHGPLRDITINLSDDIVSNPLAIDLYVENPLDLSLVPVDFAGYSVDSAFERSESREFLNNKEMIRYRYTQTINAMEKGLFFRYRWVIQQ